MVLLVVGSFPVPIGPGSNPVMVKFYEKFNGWYKDKNEKAKHVVVIELFLGFIGHSTRNRPSKSKCSF